MTNIPCYKNDDLLALLPGFHLMKIKTIIEPEDAFDEDDFIERQEYYITNQQRIKEISQYGVLGTTSATVKYQDGNKDYLYGKYENPNESVLRLIENNFLSPQLFVRDEHIIATNNLIDWLKYNGITSEALEKITIPYLLSYEIVEYPGVPTPIKSQTDWEYSIQNLTLDEREIETVLNSIEDELLRKKIECILHACIFKRHY